MHKVFVIFFILILILHFIIMFTTLICYLFIVIYIYFMNNSTGWFCGHLIFFNKRCWCFNLWFSVISEITHYIIFDNRSTYFCEIFFCVTNFNKFYILLNAEFIIRFYICSILQVQSLVW